MIEIAFPLGESQRSQAGLILYEAFRRKLQPLTGDPARTIPLLGAALNLEMVMGALVDGQLLGVAGLHSHEGRYAQFDLHSAVAAHGPLYGIRAWAMLNLFGRGSGCPAGELRIAALAVDVAARGQGVGSRLLDAIFDKARREGLRAVRLEVVDTNTGARQLYERMGFRVVKTEHYPFVRNWLDFSGDYVMVRQLHHEHVVPCNCLPDRRNDAR
jgi:ribosomal protein S18 acetylase RimI-like enzyme